MACRLTMSLLAFGLMTKRELVCLKRLQYDPFSACMCSGPYRSSLLCSGPASIITCRVHLTLHHIFPSCTYTSYWIVVYISQTRSQLPVSAQAWPHLKALSWTLEGHLVAWRVINQKVTACLHKSCSDMFVPCPAPC